MGKKPGSGEIQPEPQAKVLSIHGIKYPRRLWSSQIRSFHTSLPLSKATLSLKCASLFSLPQEFLLRLEGSVPKPSPLQSPPQVSPASSGQGSSSGVTQTHVTHSWCNWPSLCLQLFPPLAQAHLISYFLLSTPPWLTSAFPSGSCSKITPSEASLAPY